MRQPHTLVCVCTILIVITSRTIHAFGVHSSVFAHHPTAATILRSSSSSSSTTSTTSTDDDSTTNSKTFMTLFSPCKINLFLRIIRKRDDGYHDLASLFQAIGFGDTLELSVIDDNTEQDEFTCNMPGVPVDSSNLVLRALQLMREKTTSGHNNQSTTPYFKANLIKSVPAQAGLGGGSANAATAMFGANELMGRPASLEQLVEWSGALGSDITFFLSRGTAYCTGRGEIMDPIDPPLPSGQPVVLVKPMVGLSTPAVFQALNYDQLSTKDPYVLLQEFTSGKNVQEIDDDYYINDLEPPAFSCVPLLHDLKQELQTHGFPHVLMSGSGSTIFCIGSPVDKNKFQQAFENRNDLQVFHAEFIQRPNDETWFERPAKSHNT